MNLFLTHIKLVILLWDGHKLLEESPNRFKIDKINSEWSQNHLNFNVANIKVLELSSYTHIVDEILTGWTHTAEKRT